MEEITKMIPIWTAEGERELSDHRITWDWIKDNVRAYSTNYSKAKVRNDKEKEIQKDLDNAKVSFAINSTDSNGNLLNTA